MWESREVPAQRVARGNRFEKVICEQRSEGNGGVSHVGIWEKRETQVEETRARGCLVRSRTIVLRSSKREGSGRLRGQRQRRCEAGHPPAAVRTWAFTPGHMGSFVQGGNVI